MTILSSDHGRIMLGLSADHGRVDSSVFWRKHSMDFWVRSRIGDVGGGGCLRGCHVAPLIVLDVSCETKINRQNNFWWQAQNLVK